MTPKANRFQKLRALFLLALCSFVSADASAQYRFDTWTTDNGLPQNGVRQITQTPDGYLWFTTFDGLVRFDGVRFTTFGTGNTPGIINNRFTGLYRADDGTLYATTKEDGVLTVYRDGVFSSYTSEQVPGHYIQRIAPDEHGELRFLVENDFRTPQSWYYLRDGAFVFSGVEDPSDPLIVVGKSGAEWRVTTKEVIETRGATRTVYPLNIRNIDFRMEAFEDSSGHLWLGEYAVHRLGNGSIRSFREADGLPRSIHHAFWETPDGSIWFASGGISSQGVGLLQYQDGRLRAWGVDSGLRNTSIHSVFRDREGTVWLATDRGLSRLRKQVLRGFSTKDGLVHSEVYPLYRDRQDRIWIGTTKGLSIYEHGRFAALDLVPADRNAPADEIWRNPQMSVQSLWEDPAGRMWVGLNGGIHIVEHGATRMLKGAEGHDVFAIRGDRNGSVWVATNRGILRYRDRALVARLSVADGLPNDFTTVIFEDSQGQMWFGGFGGLSRLADGRLVNYTTTEGLVGNYVRSIYEDADGTLWIGTYDEGLSRFRDGRFVNFKTANGLYNNGVFAIEEDARGNFWISSNRGIYRVKRQELNDFADGKIAKITSVGYGTQDGMLSNECNGGRQPASIRDQDGRIWFPTQDGVVVIEPQNESPNTLAPSVVIESATVDREFVDVRRNLVLGPGRKDIEINFAGISLIKSEQVAYRYKLEGHDANWVDAGTRRTAYYSYLPPGRYHFVVRAANSDGIWNEEGAVLDLELRPFFYQTRLFSLLVALGAVVGLAGAWKASVHRFASRERHLAKLVEQKTEALQAAHDELLHLANSDGLTEVGNRRLFGEFLAVEWRRAIRSKTPVSLVLLDLDNFKLFNDTYGHHAGDACLKAVAAALKDTVRRPTDLLARFGGEEFAIVLGGTDAACAAKVAEDALRIVSALGIAHRTSPTSAHVTASIGVATASVSLDTSEEELIKAADDALYRAKSGGRNRISS